MAKKITLFQALRLSGAFTTIEAIKKALAKGEIALDGKIIKHPRFQFVPKQHQITWKNKPLKLFPFRYFVLNKPAGFSCQKNEQLPFVVDLLALPEKERNTLSPAGRLDVQTTGLLIITNDSVFARKIIGPEQKIPKTYAVTLATAITEKQLHQLQKGVIIPTEKGPHKAKAISIRKKTPTKLELTINEGKKRQVRLMIKAINNEVKELQRIAIGNLTLKEVMIEEGDYQEFTKEELWNFIQGKKKK